MTSENNEYCFDGWCDCRCNEYDKEFDNTLKQELLLGFTLKEMCHSNIGWFTDKTISDVHMLNEWNNNSPFGIYFLWHKDGYCPNHNLFHMKCLYVGKGLIFKRMIEHFKRKDFSEEMLVYYTYFEMPNRKAKYIEQLILDIYNIPHNKSENGGKKTLCMYFTQCEVD